MARTTATTIVIVTTTATQPQLILPTIEASNNGECYLRRPPSVPAWLPISTRPAIKIKQFVNEIICMTLGFA